MLHREVELVFKDLEIFEAVSSSSPRGVGVGGGGGGGGSGAGGSGSVDMQARHNIHFVHDEEVEH